MRLFFTLLRPTLFALWCLLWSSTPAHAQATDRLVLDFYSYASPAGFTNFAQPGETFTLEFSGHMHEVPDSGTATLELPNYFQVLGWRWQNGNVNDVLIDGTHITVIIAPGGVAGGSDVNEGRFEVWLTVKVAALADLPTIAPEITIPMGFAMNGGNGNWQHQDTFTGYMLYQRPSLSCTGTAAAGQELSCQITTTQYPIARPRALTIGLPVSQGTDIVAGSVQAGAGTIGTSSVVWDGVGSTPSQVTVSYRLRIRPKEQWPPGLSEIHVPGAFYRFAAQSDYTGNRNDGGTKHRRSYLVTTNDVTFALPGAGVAVNVTSDEDNHALSFAADECDVDRNTAGRQCTLRAAIELANARGGDDITFEIPGAATPIIHVQTAFASLPTLTENIHIYGDTQPGAGEVILDGLGTAVTGLRINGAGSSVESLRITNFAGNGIVAGANDVDILRNVITNNGLNGVRVEGDVTGVSIRENVIHDNGGLAIDLAGSADRSDGVTPNDPDDSDGGPNSRMNFPVGVMAIDRGAGTTITGIVPGWDDGVIVDIYGTDTIDPSGHGEAKRFVGAVQVSKGGAFRLDLNEHVSEPFVTATANAPDGSTSEFSAVCGDPDGDGRVDSDGDGLCDDWEIDGIDYDANGTVDLLLPNPPYSANPHRKDVYAEIDWMDCSLTSCVGNDVPHRPDVGGLQDVVDAFAAAPVDGGKGVALHLLGSNGLIDEPLPEAPLIDFYGAPGVRDDFDDIKLGNPQNACGTSNTDGHFGTPSDRQSANCANIIGAKALVFRYALWGHSMIGMPRLLGIAEAGDVDDAGAYDAAGNDLLIVLGNWKSDEPILDGRRGVEAGVFMHELGHTLGLRHGGEVSSPNCRPNYLSVMSYALTLKDMDPTRPLDYSRQRLPILNELMLDETHGVFGPADRNVVYSAFLSGAEEADYFVGPAHGPIDWDRTPPATSTAVIQDVNHAGCDEPEELTSMTGFEDWSHIVYGFRASTDYLFAVRTPPAMPIVEPTVDEVLVRAARMDTDGDGVSNASDRCPTVPDPAQLDSNGDGVGDACTPTSHADVRVTIVSDVANAAPGAAVTLTVTVTNHGPDAAPSVSIASAVPADLTVVSAQPSQGTCTGSAVVSCGLGTLVADQSVVVVLATQAATPGSVSITAHAASTMITSGDPNPANNWATTAVEVASGTTTTTTTVVGSTTTTTLECPAEASIASLDCRLTVAVRDVTAAPSFGKKQKALAKRLTSAQTSLRRAASATKAKKVTIALKAARKQMLAAKRMLGGKKIPPSVRASVLDGLTTMIADVAQVRP